MMSGFVARPPSETAPPPETDIVAGDVFWPGVSIASFRDAMKIGRSSIAEERVRDALRGAMVHVRRELRVWKLAHVLAGAPSLAAIPAETIDGESASVLLYRRAVFCMAAADLAETHHDVSATVDGRSRIDEEATAADELRRNATHAIRDILGVTRTAVELI
ncbi:head completion/stabilization protein [Croceicoccus sp. YJ47]|uniref:head completion/stabilization protein n=1 Tax=Croceicoccus sp. YJ47 TaxID=2798724 RepID=UPI00192040EC|nr:head completion/stabilization protein [Croceicoccus sp. YJ47]QQN73182.1 head completion/stabilization protein [Croceicoccus sp. YJ47]